MDDCRRIESLMTSYVDDALPQEERGGIERHLSACSPCRDHMVEERSGRAVLRERAGALRCESLPPGLRSRCEALARERGAADARPFRGRVMLGSVAAVLLAFIGVAVLSLATSRSDAVLAAQLAADHVKCFGAFLPDDSADIDPRTVEAELASAYGWNMRVPGSDAPSGLRLLGARRCLYADGLVPHVMYEAAGGEPVSLFRLDGVSRGEAAVVSLGQQCRFWSRGSRTYVLVAPERATADLALIASYVRREAH